MTKNIFITILERLIKTCKKNQVKIVFMGGIATNIWARPRTTYDIDGIISVDQGKINNFLTHLKKAGFKYDKKNPIKFVQNLSYITIIYPRYNIYIDIFIAKDEFQKGVIKRAKRINFNKLKMYVVTCEDLIIFKLLSGRDKDIEDIREMLIENQNKIDFKYLNKWTRKFNVRLFLKDELNSLGIKRM